MGGACVGGVMTGVLPGKVSATKPYDPPREPAVLDAEGVPMKRKRVDGRRPLLLPCPLFPLERLPPSRTPRRRPSRRRRRPVTPRPSLPRTRSPRHLPPPSLTPQVTSPLPLRPLLRFRLPVTMPARLTRLTSRRRAPTTPPRSRTSRRLRPSRARRSRATPPARPALKALLSSRRCKLRHPRSPPRSSRRARGLYRSGFCLGAA